MSHRLNPVGPSPSDSKNSHCKQLRIRDEHFITLPAQNIRKHHSPSCSFFASDFAIFTYKHEIRTSLVHNKEYNVNTNLPLSPSFPLQPLHRIPRPPGLRRWLRRHRTGLRQGHASPFSLRFQSRSPPGSPAAGIPNVLRGIYRSVATQPRA